jgi:hypothetical protein
MIHKDAGCSGKFTAVKLHKNDRKQIKVSFWIKLIKSFIHDEKICLGEIVAKKLYQINPTEGPVKQFDNKKVGILISNELQ